jgi:L-amino acid N-acyltransferase YncA
MHFTVDTMHSGDWTAVRTIYQEGIATKNATFETDAPEWTAWDQGHLSVCRFVLRESGNVTAWAALSPVSKRKIYAGVAEVSIYVAESARGKGFGKILLKILVESSEKAGIWTLQGGIFPENEASIMLHRLCGFRVVGRREGVGKMDGVWRDVVLMERRSKVAGI